ncbi:hypothetical protein ANCCAN_15548 [Ancylostoma caninum]|uniref:Uncharacterized protein n=1 Tax=Ancylostoma caninum TaxID=29170 RepID=A0A368G268_ANCCA|nr:hypothetical protein ANCCAN_15548 [Ancylostoma caninum]
MNGAYRARVFSRDGCSPPWMDPRHGSARSSPFTSPAPASTSDSCDLLIEDDRGTSFTRNSLFLFDDEVDMENEPAIAKDVLRRGDVTTNCVHVVPHLGLVRA